MRQIILSQAEGDAPEVQHAGGDDDAHGKRHRIRAEGQLDAVGIP